MSLAKLVVTHCLSWFTASTPCCDFVFPRPGDFTVLHRPPNSCQLTGTEKPESGSDLGFHLMEIYTYMWPTWATLKHLANGL